MTSRYALIRELEFAEPKVRKRIQDLYWGSLILSFSMLAIGSSDGNSIVRQFVGSVSVIIDTFKYHSISSAIPFLFEVLLKSIFYPLAPIVIFGAALSSLFAKRNNSGLLLIMSMPIISLALTLVYFVSHLIFASGSPELIGFFQFSTSYGFLAMLQDWFFCAGSMWILVFLCFEPAQFIYQTLFGQARVRKQVVHPTYAVGDIANGYRFTGTEWELVE